MQRFNTYYEWGSDLLTLASSMLRFIKSSIRDAAGATFRSGTFQFKTCLNSLKRVNLACQLGWETCTWVPGGVCCSAAVWVRALAGI